MKNVKAGNRLIQAREQERGVQLLELAFVLPLLLVFMGAIAEFGYYFHIRSALTTATRTGARHISANSWTTAEQNAAQNMTVCGKKTACAANEAIVKNLTASNVAVTIAGTQATGRTVKVAITGYSYTPLFFSPQSMFKFLGSSNQSNASSVPNQVSAETSMRHLVFN